jgi:hypothetical protein
MRESFLFDGLTQLPSKPDAAHSRCLVRGWISFDRGARYRSSVVLAANQGTSLGKFLPTPAVIIKAWRELVGELGCGKDEK